MKEMIELDGKVEKIISTTNPKFTIIKIKGQINNSDKNKRQDKKI